MLPPSKVPQQQAKSSSRKAFTPRPPKPAAEKLPILYRGLTDQLDDGYFDNAIKTCKKILALDPTSKAAFQTLLFLHLHTDDYTSALNLLTSPPSDALKQEPLEFERSYCLYRLHREKEALVILEALPGGEERGRKVEHLEAQIKYRLGEYEDAQDIYDDLLAGCSSSSPEYPDIQTNLKATTSHITFLNSGYKSHLTPNPATEASSSAGPVFVPSEGELESYVPSVPTGWARSGLPIPAPAAVKKDVKADSSKVKVRSKPRHKLPKGATPGKAFTQDPERWIPVRQRTSFLSGPKKKTAGKEGMGTGMTQGSTSGGAVAGGGGNGASGAKGKKGKKK